MNTFSHIILGIGIVFLVTGLASGSAEIISRAFSKKDPVNAIQLQRNRMEAMSIYTWLIAAGTALVLLTLTYLP